MTVSPWASFCIATYRRPVFLRDTLQAITRQSFPDYEIIVSDNDPEGTSQSVVETLNDPRVRYFRQAENVGMVKNFNRALAQARGEFVVMICDDDPVYPEMLAKLKALSDTHPGYGAYYGAGENNFLSAEIARCYGTPLGKVPCLATDRPPQAVRAFSAEEFPHAFFRYQVFPYCLWSTGIVRRSIALDIGGMPDYDSPFLTDFAYIVLAGAHSGCVTLNTVLGYQSVHEANFGRKEFSELNVALRGAHAYLAARFARRSDWGVLRPRLEKFLGGWIVGHLLFLRRYFKLKGLAANPLTAEMLRLFAQSYMYPYFLKYLIKVYLPVAFRTYRQTKQFVAHLRRG
jgi:glycosyltransferase involved in cell wall biosynthesis